MINRIGRMKQIINFSPFFGGFVTVMATLGKIILPLPLRILYGLRIKGKRNLRKIRTTGAITVANHCQYLEPIFPSIATWPRRMWFAAEENNVTRRDIGWLTRRLGVFGIPDNNPMLISGPVKEALRKKHLVHFYPEGALFYRNQRIKPFMKGAFLFSLVCNVPVIPMTEVLRDRPIRKIIPFFPPRVTFVIGEPVYPETFMKTGNKTDRLGMMSETVHRIMQETIDRERGCLDLPERIEERKDLYAGVH